MKKSQLKEIIREILSEELELESQASDDAKAQGLEYRAFGRWGKKGGPITHTTQGGKLVPIKTLNPQAAHRAKTVKPGFGDRSPEGQKRRNRPQPEKDAEYKAYGRTGTDAGNRIVSKVNDKFTDNHSTLLDKYKYYDDIPADEFTSATGIPKKAAVWTAQNNDDYEQPFSYDAKTDTFSIHDPREV